MFTADELAATSSGLKKTVTTVTQRDGRKFTESRAKRGDSVLTIELPQTEEERNATAAALRPDALSLTLTSEMAAATSEANSRPADQLRIVTWNIWFDPSRQDERLQMLLSEALRTAPDMSRAQEVGPVGCGGDRSCMTLNALYVVSPFSISQYGVLMLVRRSLAPTFSIAPLPSQMGRSLLIATRVQPSSSQPSISSRSTTRQRAARSSRKRARPSMSPLQEHQRAAPSAPQSSAATSTLTRCRTGATGAAASIARRSRDQPRRLRSRMRCSSRPSAPNLSMRGRQFG